MVESVRLLAADKGAWQGSLLAVFVADEEAASEGAKHYAKSRPKIDSAVIGKPTGNAVVTAHKGSVRPRIRVVGETAHTGTPDLGVNAIYKAAALVRLIEVHHETLRERTHPLCG